MVFMVEMTAANRSRLAWFGAALLAFLAWLVWPLSEASIRFVKSPASPQSTAEPKPRAERRRDGDAPTSNAPAQPEPVVAKEPSKPNDEPTIPFVVTVLRGDGTPAAGASVLLTDATQDGTWSHEVARAKTDDKGVATLRPPGANVRVAAWLGVEATTTDEILDVRERHEAALRLSPAMIVRGRVLSGDATVADADVALTAAPWFHKDFALALRTKSDAAGRFEFPPFPFAGIDSLNPPVVEAKTKDMARGYADTDPSKPDAEIDVRLTSGFTVRGRFVDADGKPVAVELRAAGPDSYGAKTNAAGNVELRLPAGKYEFVALHPTDAAYVDEDFDVEVACPPMIADPFIGHWKVAHAVGATSEGSSDVDFGDVVFRRGKPVVGVVVDPSSAPSPNASVMLFLGDVRVGGVVADAKGRFEFPEVGDEPHRVHVREALAAPGASGTRHADVEGVRGGCAELRVVLRASLLVTLRFLSDEDRKPIVAGDVAVKAFHHGERDECAGHSAAGAGCDSDGIEVPAAGSYDVEVVVGGYEPQRFESVEVIAGRPTALDVLLRKKRP